MRLRKRERSQDLALSPMPTRTCVVRCGRRTKLVEIGSARTESRELAFVDAEEIEAIMAERQAVRL